MKRVLFSLMLMAFLPAMIIADPVDTTRAQKAANTFLSNNGMNTTRLTDLTAEAGFANLYVFNADHGFVVMAADDRVQPVLGFSLTGSFDPNVMPDNVRAWLQGYDDEIQFVVESHAKATPETKQQWQDLENGVRGTKATVVVEPLLSTMWDQGEPYYNLCPTATSGGTTYHAVTGCVATAMAQIMKYWNWPIKGNGSHSYRPSGFAQQSVNFGNTTYDWANMTDTYDANSTSAEQTAVATLMWHCGVSVDMSYGLDASGAQSSSIPYALKNYFRYNTNVSMKYKSSYTNTNWTNLIKGELDAHRPVQYSGNDGSVGHAFVCDGYDNSNYFHFNWGWSGMFDGYFTLNTLNPGTGGTGSGSGNYNQSQSAIINWYPTYSVNSAPTLTVTLTQNQTTRNANLSWTSLSGVSSYQVFRNRKLIATTTSTSYTDVKAPYGNNKYYVRGVTSSNGISQPSNEVSVAFDNPTNLVATLEEGVFNTSWTGTSLAHSYNLYCNGFNIGSEESTSLSFTLGAYGDLSFCVTAVDFNGDESMPSNVVTIQQPYEGPVVNDLYVTPSETKATLSWTGKTGYEFETSHLEGYTGTQVSIGGLGTDELYWAIRFPAATLSFYAGMALQYVNTYIYDAGTYDVSLYQCTGDIPSGAPIASVSNVYSTQAGWTDISFGGAIYLDITKDLWVVFHESGLTYYMTFVEYDSEDGNYYSVDGNEWYQMDGYTWAIYIGLADDDFTYNVYCNGNMIAQNLTDTTYVDTGLSNNTLYKYTVRTNYFGRESADSNFYGFVLGTASTDEAIEMERKDTLVLKQNSCFTVNAHLSNRRPGNLIIENGAQLIANDGVAVTIQKNLPASWNWWAPNVVADDLFARLKTSLGGDAVLINSQGSGFVCYENNQWNGTLDDVAPGQMYKIWMDRGRSITTIGTTTSGVEVTIAPGNNWLGCPTTRNVGLSELGIVPADGDTISSLTQSAIYQNGAWTGTLTHLQPGQGYVYHSNAEVDKTLVLP